MALSVHTCPDCSRVIQFPHPDINIIQCACGAVLQLVEGVMLKKTSIPIIDFSNDVIEVGSNGAWNNQSFKITGRFRAWFNDSVVNYWTIIFDNNETGYLCEGYGLYSILVKTTNYKSLPSSTLDALKPGNTRSLNGDSSYQLKSKQQINKIEMEGAVCLPVNKNEILVYEFASANGEQVTMIEFLKNYIITYKTFYTSFTNLQLTGLSRKEKNYKEFTCSKCQKQYQLKTWPYMQSFVCHECKTFYDIKNGNFKALDKNVATHKSDLEIGSNGTVDDILYEVIAYALKEDTTIYHSRWKEYTLYNQQEGFAFLSEYQGHWIFLREKGNAPVIVSKKEQQFYFNEEPFKLYNDYGYKVIDAVGEFPYHLLDTGNTTVKEFISPPEMWSEERNRDNITWFHGKHISKQYIETNFSSPSGLPWPAGVGMLDTKGYINPFYLVKVSILAFIVFIGIHFILGSTKLNRQVLDTLLYFDSANTVSYVSDNFMLTKAKSNLQFDMVAPVSNSWVSITATLVNTDDGTEYKLQKAIEYYYGYDSDGRWSEGSTKGIGYISSIPKGSYKLLIDGQKDPALASANYFNITVTYDTPNDKNLAVILIVIVLWPLGKYLLIHYNERRRWYNSAYSPYTYEN